MHLFRHSLKGGQKIDIADPIQLIRHPLRNIATLLYTKRKVKQLFDELNPALIVTTTEDYVDRFLLGEANQRRIPSLCLFSVIPDKVAESSKKKRSLIKFLLTNFYNIKMLWAIALRLLSYPCWSTLLALGFPLRDMAPAGGRATKVSVWNEEHREILVEKGGNRGRIVVTGSPLHDMIYRENSGSGQEIVDRVYKLLDIEKTEEIILFTSQPSAKYGVCSFEEQKNLTELIIKTCARFDGYTLVIKLHPRESVEDYGYINESLLLHRFRLIADKDADLYDLIYVSRLVLNQDSTVGIDALLFNKDVITISMLTGDTVDYAKAGASLSVDQEEKLFDALYKVFNDENVREELREGRKRYITRYLPGFDGKATDRVVGLLYQLVNGKST